MFTCYVFCLVRFIWELSEFCSELVGWVKVQLSEDMMSVSTFSCYGSYGKALLTELDCEGSKVMMNILMYYFCQVNIKVIGLSSMNNELFVTIPSSLPFSPTHSPSVSVSVPLY